MGIFFGCKHKEVRIIACDKNAKYYVVQCVKCNAQWSEPKAVGEMYNVGISKVIR